MCVMLLEISHHTKGACGNLTIHFIMGHGAPYFPTLSSMDDEHKSVSTFKGKGTGQFPSPTEVVGSSTGPSLTVVNLTDYFSVKTAGQIMRSYQIQFLLLYLNIEFLLLPSVWARF